MWPLKLRGRYYFPPKELNWRNWSHRKALTSSAVKENQQVWILQVRAMNPGKDWARRQICRGNIL